MKAQTKQSLCFISQFQTALPEETGDNSISSSLAASHSSCDTGEKSPVLLKPSKWALLPQKPCKTSSGSPHSSVTILGPTHPLHVPHACWCLAHASLVYFHLLTSWADWALFYFVLLLLLFLDFMKYQQTLL